jgi:hypothetical protein
LAYLPSKKFIIVALIVLLAGGGFWFSKKRGTKNNPLFPKDKSSSSANFGQGEKNWEEVLWEIASSSPGINAKMFSDADSSGGNGGLTKTDLLARDFISSYLALKQSGNLSPENKQKLTESFLAGIEQEKLPDKYQLPDLKIIEDNSNEALKNYGSEVLKIINKYQARGEESEITIINEALQRNDGAELQKLDLNINLYKEVSQELLTIKAPRNMSDYHLELINGIYNLADALTNVQSTFKDPVTGVIGIKQYQKEYLRISNALQIISKYFPK